MSDGIELESVTARVFRFPLEVPVRTSFGTMRDRPAVLVEARAKDGARGLGEVWCNFPSVGAEHRARLVNKICAPLLTARSFSRPAEAFEHLTASLAVLALQTGEDGPLAQAIAGIDIALWDLAARQAGMPLNLFLGGEAVEEVGAYASGLNPDMPEKLALQRARDGHTAFKLKVGFGEETDLTNVKRLRAVLGAGVRLMVDANQAWNLETAARMADRLAEHRIDWLEEPMRADTPPEDWRALAARSPIKLAAGENIRGGNAFSTVISAGAISVIQPDLAKWGGFTGCLPVARSAIAAGRRYCPHFLGGGIGLIASLHLLAAAGGDGLLEIDSNPNPLREMMAAPFPALSDGRIIVPSEPGLGVTPDLAALAAYEIHL
ncbi:mandelate racemase/muconate lactonizing enzyme family protein [Afifella sp. IM 167]|uniref:mandelate racemase/muconate lactonizing enzyme family protein n=1 Tax=Afifella sp. IM 167 TaxID=2033586 RepID=UPI001CC9F122|nr:mandelate racemase/muconate lactonizing enzyme family protein [Afifella sp. IM 167]MBZ8134286.1 mandelate racemase [Afifella sp. IM 167]